MQLMSIEDLAVYLGDSKRTIYNYIASGDCPAYIRISAKNIKFDRADVDAWLKSKKVINKTSGMEKKLVRALRAQQAVKSAEQEARRLGQDYVGTEHLLMGLLADESSISSIVLKNLQIDTGRLQVLYEKACGQPEKAPYLQNTLAMAVRLSDDTARSLGHEYVGTEHLLLAIFGVSGSKGCEILRQLDVSYEKVLKEIKKLIMCPGEAKAE